MPHASARAGDLAEPGVSVGAWHPGLCRARQNVEVRHSPIRVVKGVKRLKPELQNMILVVRHLELLMHLKVDVEDARAHDGIPPDIAELPERGFVISRQAKVARRRRAAQIRAETGCGGTVVASRGIRVIHAADGKGPWCAALQREDTAGLPTADDGIEEPVVDVSAASSEGARSTRPTIAEILRLSLNPGP